MKKIVALLSVVVLAFSLSFCVFAATSPSGEVETNKFTVIGTVTRGKKRLVGVKLELKPESKYSTTDSTGSFRFEKVEAGSYTLSAFENDNPIAKLVFKLAAGDKTSYKVLEDGSYEIVLEPKIGIANLSIVLDETSGMKIIEVTSNANTSKNSPKTGDVATTVCLALLLLSCGGVLTTVGCKIKNSL